ncbi:MAG: glycosyltransferase family 4 protein [Thermoanaerobaculia bacterium]|nr:glycosyltransferase family 4 protein [Thermoanaerobaculia bacterium]
MTTTLIGPVYPYRGGIPYCTTRLAEELRRKGSLSIISFSRQYPQRFYPGGSDLDVSLRGREPEGTRFLLDIVNPLTWIATALRIRREAPDSVIFVWWIWVWALPYLTILALLPRKTRVVLQSHNISDKEPSWWKSVLTNAVLWRGDVIVVHADSERDEAERRLGGTRIISTYLPVHEVGGAIPSRHDAKSHLEVHGRNVALFFGHIRPYKGLDIAIRAWERLETDVLLLVAGQAWWKGEEEYRALARNARNIRFNFRFIPDDEIAMWFAAADVVIAPYRTEAQSGVAMTSFYFHRPIIAAAVGGIPEVVRDGVNGYLIAPEDPAALALAVDRFFTEADRAAMELACAESARRNSWSDYAALIHIECTSPST